MISLPPTLPLALKPTAIEYLSRLSATLDSIALYLKRDDQTGSTLTGNKVRKLEFLLPDALRQGCDTLITCGGVQSNHARATALVAAQYGLKSILLLRGEEPAVATGNLLLDKLAGADIRYITPRQFKQANILMETICQKLADQGRKGYPIPTGGSNPLGSLGYLQAGLEIAEQLQGKPTPEIIAVAVGSGGTMAGLLAGIKLAGLQTKVVGFCVCDSTAYFQKEIHNILIGMEQQFNLQLNIAQDEIEIIEDYIGAGYAKPYPEAIDFIKKVAQMEGIILDPVYTGKGMYGFYEELRKQRWGTISNALFIHTGGVFGLTDIPF